MNKNAKSNVLSSWANCKKAATWLERSYQQSPVPPFSNISENDWDQLEALASRYARLTDLLVHRMLRALDLYEFLEPGSIIDAANRAVKRGFIEGIDELRDFKDLRNEIVHEYSVDNLEELYSDIYDKTPELLRFKNMIGQYVEQNVDGRSLNF